MSDDPHAPLRDDVRLLGRLLGDELSTQGSPALFACVERVRRLAKGAAADSGDQSTEALDQLLTSLPVEEMAPVARAFATFLRLANIAEQHHRVRRRRAYLRGEVEGPQRGSFEEIFERLAREGVDAKTVHDTVAAMRIELVLTAHPTEVMRRTLLVKQRQVASLLAQRDRADQTPEEQALLESALAREVASIWATDELRRDRPTPEDEARGGLAIVEQVLWDAVPRILRTLDGHLRHHTGSGLPHDSSPLRFGSWMGGDRDGNPRVTAEVTRRVVLLSRWMGADLYLREIKVLHDELSMNECSDELRERVGDAWEPYRALLRQVEHRLENTLAWAEAMLEGHPPPEGPVYASADELAEPLLLCDRSLRACRQEIVAEGRLLDLQRRLHAFGIALLHLDLRQESDRHTQVLDTITRHLGMGSYAQWSEDERVAFLVRELEGRRPLVPRDLEASEEVREVFATLEVAAQAPPEALGAYVISMARAPSDVLAVELLQREAGMRRPLRVVPLFETVEDLSSAEQTMNALFEIPWYRRRIDGRQEIMIGYSDSAKRAGRLAASWALYRAQEVLVRLCAKHEVALTLFHGRGGSVGRGGGPIYEGIVSQPPGAVNGRLRVTEQGEVIHAKFGVPGIALRTLELYLSAVLEATLVPPPGPEDRWRTRMDELAATSRGVFEEVVQSDPQFVELFRAVTPEQELSRLEIGSRPARRRQDGGLESLRAIPWVFAWTQNRMLLPAWLGVGEAIDRAIESGHEAELTQMAQRWPFFAATLSMLEMVVAKSRPEIARRYVARLAPPEQVERGHALLERLDRSAQAIERLSGRPLLSDNPVLRRSIDVRNPYVDPLNLLQIELLQRVRRNADPPTVQALLLTINGIAAGMRNTG
jgi:phosphoenolpyruvate carboxylase